LSAAFGFDFDFDLRPYKFKLSQQPKLKKQKPTSKAADKSVRPTLALLNGQNCAGGVRRGPGTGSRHRNGVVACRSSWCLGIGAAAAATTATHASGEKYQQHEPEARHAATA